MINILKSEYSFKKCFMHMEDMLPYTRHGCLGIADINNTYGHIKFEKMCKKNNIQPVFGVRLNLMTDKETRRCDMPTLFVAKDSAGLQEIYKLVALAYDQFYYIPRIYIDNIASLEALGRVLIATPTLPLTLALKDRLPASKEVYLGVSPGIPM